MAEQQDLVYFNGINASTGGYLLEPMPLVEFVERVVIRFLESEAAKPFLRLAQSPSGDFKSITPMINSRDLRELGWGLLFPAQTDPSWFDRRPGSLETTAAAAPGASRRSHADFVRREWRSP